MQVRGWFPGWRFHLFNPVFICTYQLLLLLAIAAPAAVAANRTSRPINLVRHHHMDHPYDPTA